VITERRALITGGWGFIGSWTAVALANAGCTVGIFDQGEDRALLHRIAHPRCRESILSIQGDIRNLESVQAAFDSFRPSAVLHLAAVLIPACQSDPALGAGVNVVGLVNIFEAARKAGVARIVYTSSAAAHVRDDSGALTSLYGAYKLVGEEIARIYWVSNRISSIGLRPCVVYGYGRGTSKAGGGLTAAFNHAIVAAIRGKHYEIPLTGSYRFETVEEVSNVIAKCISADLDGSLVSDITTREMPVTEFAAILMRLFPHSHISCSQIPTVERTEMADNAPLRALIGEWSHIDPATGIARLAERFRDDILGGS
jgi:nucleoside-diphosphate-sugar epimerase